MGTVTIAPAGGSRAHRPGPPQPEAPVYDTPRQLDNPKLSERDSDSATVGQLELQKDSEGPGAGPLRQLGKPSSSCAGVMGYRPGGPAGGPARCDLVRRLWPQDQQSKQYVTTQSAGRQR